MEDFLAWDVTKGSRLKSAIQLEYADVGRGIAMKKRIVIALLATSFAAGTSFAADWPFAAPPQLSRAGFSPCRLDGPLCWSECRLRFGHRIVNDRFDRRVCGRHDNPIGNWGNGAQRYELGRLEQPARRHCRRSNRLQLAGRDVRLRRRG